MKLVIGHFYPELLNLYGDKGNITTLKKRAEWRDIEVEIKEIKIDDEVDFSEIDIMFIGGGSDREQRIVLKRLHEIKDKIKEYIENDGVMLAICGGYQMLGNYCYLGGNKEEGISVIDMETENGNKRLTSNVILDTPFGKVAGFESHQGRTYIKDNTPFGNVVYGNGNNGEDKKEGVIYKNVIGTNLYGPLLPKNPNIADSIIKNALMRKYGEEITLKELDDSIDLRAKDYIINLYTSKI